MIKLMVIALSTFLVSAFVPNSAKTDLKPVGEEIVKTNSLSGGNYYLPNNTNGWSATDANFKFSPDTSLSGYTYSLKNVYLNRDFAFKVSEENWAKDFGGYDYIDNFTYIDCNEKSHSNMWMHHDNYETNKGPVTSEYEYLDFYLNPDTEKITAVSGYFVVGSMDSWTFLVSNKLEKATNAGDYDFVIRDVQLNEGDEFKVATAYWATGTWGYSNILDTTCLEEGSKDNCKVKAGCAGYYDIYLDIDAGHIRLVIGAKQILTAADLIYTRNTSINLTAAVFEKVRLQNYFTCMTAERTTYFVDGGLFMTTKDYSTNSGYYSKSSENSGNNMYHFIMKDGAGSFSEEDAEIANIRKDSSSKSVNDFYRNAHWFNTRADDFSPYFEYDFEHDRYVCHTDVTLSGDSYSIYRAFLDFTAPLLVNKGFTFSGVGLQWNAGKVQFILYTEDPALILDGEKAPLQEFSIATLENIGTTEIAALKKYIAG